MLEFCACILYLLYILSLETFLYCCGFSRPVCLDKVGSDVICLINGLTTSSSALIRAKLIVNRLTVWTFSLRAKSCDKTLC